jgi:hypothetical protein
MKDKFKKTFRLLSSNSGLAEIPLMIGLLLMAIALPVATKLVQNNQDTRNRAAYECSQSTYPTTSCFVSGIKYAWSCNTKTGGWECKVTTPVATATPISPTPTVDPTACGNSGQACCYSGMSNPTCKSGLVCAGTGTCLVPTSTPLPTALPTSTCGNSGQACCYSGMSNPTCKSGLVCAGTGTCLVPTSTPLPTALPTSAPTKTPIPTATVATATATPIVTCRSIGVTCKDDTACCSGYCNLSTSTCSVAPTVIPQKTNTPVPTVRVSLSPTPTYKPGVSTATPTPTKKPGSATSTPTPIVIKCGYAGCSMDGRVCETGTYCRVANDGKAYCSLYENIAACKVNPGVPACCTAPTKTPVLTTPTSTTIPSKTCGVTVSPAMMYLTVGGLQQQFFASVTSGLVTGQIGVPTTVSSWKFGSYNTNIAIASPTSTQGEVFRVFAYPVASGNTAIWATATLSDGRVCETTGDTDMDVFVTVAKVTPTPTCVPRPPCLDGVRDSNGNVIYCDPQPGVIYCPRLTPTTGKATSTPTPPAGCYYFQPQCASVTTPCDPILRCPTLTPTATPTGVCGWCGPNCVRKTSDMVCTMQAPPSGYQCTDKGGCLAISPTPPAGCYYQQVQCVQAPCYPILVCPTLTPTKTLTLTPTPTKPVVCVEQCPGTDGVLRNCHPPEADGTSADSVCNLKGRIEFCGTKNFCCPAAGGVWSSNLALCATLTPTPTATKTLTPTPTVTKMPTSMPTATKTLTPTVTKMPTITPMATKTLVPTKIPTEIPTKMPTITPMATKTLVPTKIPTEIPTKMPTITPLATKTLVPTKTPVVSPTETPIEVLPTNTPVVVLPTRTPSPVKTVTPVPTSPLSLCTECSNNFKCYVSLGEYKWFTSGLAMQGFALTTDPLCGGVPKPQFLGKSKGDANCDGAIDTADYSLWHKEFYDGDAGVIVSNQWNADFTGPDGVCDGIVDTADYSLWHKYFYELIGTN